MARKKAPHPALTVPSEDELQAHIRDALERAAYWERRAEGYRVMLDALRIIAGHLSADEPGSADGEGGKAEPRPATTPEAILRVMAVDDPEGIWTPVRMHDHLVARGWGPRDAANPIQTVGATMSRMVTKGQLVKLRKAHYRMPALTTGGI